MKTFEQILLLACVLAVAGCFGAGGHVEGTGINVQDSAHYVTAQVNSFNASGNVSVK